MNDPQQPDLPAKGQFLVYPAEDGRMKIEVRLENETVWLTQQYLADLFQTSKQNVGQHLKNIFEERELAEDSVVKNFFTTAADAKKSRQISTTSTPSFPSVTASRVSSPPASASGPRKSSANSSSKASSLTMSV